MGGCKNIEVLCATMHQNDFSNYYAMNIHDCDVIFANQSDEFSYQEMTVGANSVKMLTTTTRGVGKNRNLALVMASSEILLLADDDLTYDPDMPQMVSAGFQCFPDADMIVFGTKYMKNGNVYKCRKPKSKRLSFFKALRYGTCALAVRRSSILKHNLRFTELFGGGCQYSYGEDTDFIVQCFRKHLRIYSYSEVIATTSKDSSTCFSGYGEKYFFDKGALARHSLRFIAVPYMVHMARKDLKSDLRFWEKIKFLWSGYRSFPDLISYSEWLSKYEENHHC